MRTDGRLRFGDAVRPFGDEAPPAYAHVVRYVRETFDREALREAVDDVESVVFFGRAMHRRGVDYEWERTPSFLGTDVWSAAADGYLLPDRVEKIYRRLGFEPLEPIESEVRAADFDPGSYAFPRSAWYDGPVAGVVVRNKTGARARLLNPAVGGTPGEPSGVDDAGIGADDAGAEDDETAAEAFARRYATSDRLAAVARRLREEGRPVTFDALFERTVETITRAQHHRLFGGEQELDRRAFRSAVAARTRAYLAERESDASGG
jgi:hypothetical protein